MYFVEWIGDNSVELTQVVSIICLLHINAYLILAYIIGFLINTKINNILKKWLDPFTTSGHFQKIFYSLVFVGLLLYKTNKLSLYWRYITGVFVIAGITCLYNCLVHQYHTIPEIVVGSGIGTLVGYSAAWLSGVIVVSFSQNASIK